jgi:hypothetical protein
MFIMAWNVWKTMAGREAADALIPQAAIAHA